MVKPNLKKNWFVSLIFTYYLTAFRIEIIRWRRIVPT